jgi:uncharacterized membrane protein HdeD (DUF308 family)
MADLNTNILQSIKGQAPLFKKWGIALIVIGVLAILFPLVFSIAAKTLLGWIFLLSGAALLWHAFQSTGWRSATFSGLIAVMHLALGVYLGFFALTGLVGLTFMLGVIFLCQGGIEVLMANQHRPEQGWGGRCGGKVGRWADRLVVNKFCILADQVAQNPAAQVEREAKAFVA